TGRRKVIVGTEVSPIYRKMIYCYTSNLNIEFKEMPCRGGSGGECVENYFDRNTAAIIIQNPNFFGVVDDYSDLVKAAHHVGALAVMSVYPISLALLKTPGEMDADIVTGEGQSLGLPLSFGGPYLGFMATKMEHVRKMPGRLVGRTQDAQGRTGFVLTLQTREQHIRREKATSNICTNEALCALAALVYMSLMGKQGLVETAQLCLDKAAYAKERLAAIPGVTVADAPVFNEFVVTLPRDAGDVVGRLIDKNIAAGFPLGRYYEDMDRSMLVAVTEKRTKEEIGLLAEYLAAEL
ncbi:MAG: aminomethyl-transferring glycine dehydrogenase subunit GcvPA, partial [Deltaproteobacteria bacterium]|nr:aminomethyl-transferring glycine dehydrogenase subunit GcvPA [Deltaproteobacteria bacterium]